MKRVSDGRHVKLAASSAVAVAALLGLSACSHGSDDDPAEEAPQFLANAETCKALTGKFIPSSAIGESSTGASVTSATYNSRSCAGGETLPVRGG